MPELTEPPIRSVSRALHVLQAINRHGALTMTQISKEVKLPYPTTCRVVLTLVSEGVIEREKSRKYYRPTALSQSLSCGYHQRSRLVAIARRHIEKLTEEVRWPISLASRVGPYMVIQDSTHALTTLTFSEYHPGYSLPILSCASGLAYLAYMEPEKRHEIIDQLEVPDEDNMIYRMISNNEDSFFAEIRKDHYATYIKNPHTKNPGKTSSIAMPLHRDKELVGTMALIFFSTSMRVAKAFDTFGDLLLETQANINKDLTEMKLFRPENFDDN